MSKLLFAGSRTDSVVTASGTINDSAAPGSYDAAYSDAGINVKDGAAKGVFYDPATAPILTPYVVETGATVYFHAYLGFGDGAGQGQYVQLLDGAGVPWIQINQAGQVQYNSGSAEGVVWTNLGAAGGTLGGQQGTLDIVLAINSAADHTLTMAYLGNAVVGPIMFSQPLLTGIGGFQFGGGNHYFEDAVWSQILCTENISTINGHVFTRRATGAGAHSDWTGTYTDVNEQITDDTTFNSAMATGLAQSYPMANIAVPDGCEILGAFHWLRGKNGGASPANIQSLIRTSADVDHESGNLPGIGVTFSQFGARYDVNPDTGVAWTEADWNAPVQLGFVSEA